LFKSIIKEGLVIGAHGFNLDQECDYFLGLGKIEIFDHIVYLLWVLKSTSVNFSIYLHSDFFSHLNFGVFSSQIRFIIKLLVNLSQLSLEFGISIEHTKSIQEDLGIMDSNTLASLIDNLVPELLLIILKLNKCADIVLFLFDLKESSSVFSEGSLLVLAGYIGVFFHQTKYLKELIKQETTYIINNFGIV